MSVSISNSNKRIAKNTILLSIRMVFILLISLYTTRVLLSSLGVEDYGIYNIVCGFVSMFAFISSSLANGIQRFYNFELSRDGVIGARRVYNSAVLIQTILAIILVFLCETIGLWYVQNKMVISPDRISSAIIVFHMSIVSFAISILEVPYMAAIMAHEKMDYYALVTVIDAILKLIVVITLPYWMNDRLEVYGVLSMLIALFNLVMYSVYTKLKFKHEIILEAKIHSGLLKSMLSFSGWNIFGRIGDMLREQGVNVLLNAFFGVIVNAARGVAFQVIGGLQSLVSNIATAIRPQIIQSYAQNNISRTFRLMYTMSKFCFLFLFIIALPILVEINYVLNLWLGDNVPQYTSIFVNLAIIVTFINVLNSAVSAVVHATGKMALYQSTGTMATIMILPVSYVVLKFGGSPVAPFVVGVVFAVIMQIVALLVLKKLISNFSYKEYCQQVIFPILKVIILTIAVPFIISHLMKEGFLRLTINLAFSILWGCVVTYFMGLNESEKNVINMFILKIVRK